MEQKWWLNSATVRGALVTLVPAIALVLQAFGVDLGSEEQEGLINGVVAIVGLAGTVYAIAGRAKASSVITFKKQ